MILATNEDLSKAVAEGRFRQDLYYRVNVINIELPPLRERLSDIPLLAKHFLEEVCQESGRKVTGFSEDALTALQRYRWPGNVRELQNVVERAVLLGKGDVIQVEDLPPQLAAEAPISAHADPGRNLKQAMAVAREADHSGSAGAAQLEPPGDPRRTGHQPHDALQEDEAAGVGRRAVRAAVAG